jgi:hypothetical protein
MKRAVRSVIRWIAAGFLLVGGLELGLEFERYRLRGEAPGWGRCLLGIVLAMAGGVLFWASGRLAGKLTDDFDE